MDSLVSFDGAADVINNLVNKLSNALGWVATHSAPQREAVSTYIQEIQNSNHDLLAALISNAKKLSENTQTKAKLLKMQQVF